MENYEIIDQIGTDIYGKIFKVLRKTDNKVLILKELFYGDMTDKEKHQLVTELNILRELKHPNITRYYDRIIDKQNQKISLITEYCESGDLSQLIKRLKRDREYLSEETIWKFFMQIVIALHAIHRRKEGKILHRDIKPACIYIDSYNNLKLGDFRFFKTKSDDDSEFSYTSYGTLYYIAPEQLEENWYSEKSDIWAVGCLLYELCTLTPPFGSPSSRAKTGKLERIPNRYSNELQRVILWIMTKNSKERPTVDDLLNIPEISMRLREKRLRDSKDVLRKKEDDVAKKMESVEELESSLKLRENELKIKESKLMEQERRLKEMKERPKYLVKERDSVNDDMIKFKTSPKYGYNKQHIGVHLSSDLHGYRRNGFENHLEDTEYKYGYPVTRDFDTEPSSNEAYYNADINQMMRSLDNIIYTSTQFQNKNKEFDECEYSDKENYDIVNI